MFVLSVFELSDRIEEALTALEISGISRAAIKAVPMESRNENKGLFDTSHYSDNASTLSLPFITAMLGTFFGIIFGFQLYLGPIWWGFFGAVGGFATGLIISITYALFRKRNQKETNKPSVIVIVNCLANQADMTQEILWTNAAMGVKCLI